MTLSDKLKEMIAETQANLKQSPREQVIELIEQALIRASEAGRTNLDPYEDAILLLELIEERVVGMQVMPGSSGVELFFEDTNDE